MENSDRKKERMMNPENKMMKAGPTEASLMLTGDWPDPTILKDGDDYYMTHSSLYYRPGLLILHSKDLKTWKPLCCAVKNQQGSIWAPELLKHEGKYYIYYPCVTDKSENWVVTADSIDGPWSEPAPIGAGCIDPGHIADDEGRRFIHLSGGNLVDLTPDGKKAVGNPRKVYDGWPIPEDWAVECFCLESPKLLKKDGWYHLVSAQGGTFGPSTSHMVVSARSRTPAGPWENSPFNPVIRTWSRREAWWSKGHGTLVEGPDGRWYCVLHAIMNGNRSLGRCTVVEPVEWTEDGWFRADASRKTEWDAPGKPDMPLSDAFCSDCPGIQWKFYKKFDSSRFTTGNGRLTLKGIGEHPGDSQPLCVMPADTAYEIETEVETEGHAKAGIMLFSSPDAYVGMEVSGEGAVRRIQKGCTIYKWIKDAPVGSGRVKLKIVNDEQDVRFYYMNETGGWKITQPGMEISALRSVHIALFVYGKGQAHFMYFRYKNIRE